MSEHSPEPWTLDETRVVDQPIEGLRDCRDWEIDTLEGNLARIVACVNACKGIPTDALEKMTMGELAIGGWWT